MKLTITVDIQEDFKQLCEIFNFDPIHVIQEFTNKISFPVLYSQPINHHHWANFFFLDYLGAADNDKADKWEIHEPFMSRMVQCVSKDSKESEQAGRVVMEDWHQFITNKRTNALLSKVKEENKDE